MLAKNVKEWTIDCVFGKISMICWGDPAKPPILMIHGYMDTAATFSLLVDQLPDRYCYVSFDIPGHGKSDPMPAGPPPTQEHLIEVMRTVVDHMGWDTFVTFAHSMGCTIAMFYNRIFPGRISKMVHFDPLLSMINYFYLTHDMQTYYSFFYDEYYTNFSRYTASPKLITYEAAVARNMKNRELTRKQAEVVLSRSLKPVTKDLYRSTYQPEMWKLGLFHVQTDIFLNIISNQPPTLSLVATQHAYQTVVADFADQILQILKKKGNLLFYIEGPHDIHIARPEVLAPLIVKFLDGDNLKDKKSKL